MKPRRIQRKRIKGWRMPENTVYVGRPSIWGNPYHYKDYGRELAVKRYVDDLSMMSKEIIKKELRGKNLACWCPILDKQGLYVPCHADILLSIANNMSKKDVKNQNLCQMQGRKTIK